MSATGKKILLNQAIVADTVSLELDLQDANSASFQMTSVGGTIVATAQIFTSNDPEADPADIVSPTDSPGWLPQGSPLAITAGGGEQELTDLESTAPYLKAVVFVDWTSDVSFTSFIVRAVKKGTALR